MSLVKIGIIAGVFDPIHLGHTRFISRAIRENGLDEVYVLVEREPKYKSCIASYEHRKKMADLAITGIPQASIYESESGYFPITSSLPDIRKANPNSRLFLLLGDDVAEHISQWQNSKELLESVELIVAKRGKSEPYSQISSLKVRNKLAENKTAEIDAAVLSYCRRNGLY